MKKQSAFLLVYDPKVDKYLLGKRTSENRKGYWDFFGGTLEEGEYPRKGCLREVKEETGIKFKSGVVFKLKKIERREKVIHIFFVLAKKKDLEIKLNEEHSKFGWFNKRKFPKKLTPTTERIQKEL